ncbi:MAG: ATP-dependent DNA helicase [Candidatus Marinimicrobia bacterium]|jgi:Rad3-related DNA helicase|nr:ATP-dependent DNA helicase [Candidatus Neomarinimicrobiota bacterium]
MLTPQEINLPKKFQNWEGKQAEIIEDIVRSNEPLYLLDAPTGSGKSVIGIASSYIWRTNWLTSKILSGEETEGLPKRVIYVTKTKQLQDQLLHDFPNSKTIKGRKNFRCLLAPEKFPEFSAEDCPKRGKEKDSYCKFNCPYLLAKNEALNAEIAVLNESYYLSEINGPGLFRNADFVILDEVDSIESTLMNHISIFVSISILKDFGLQAPQNCDSWKEWIRWWCRTDYQRTIVTHSMKSNIDMFEENWSDVEIKFNKKHLHLNNFNDRLETFMKEILFQLNTLTTNSPPKSLEDIIQASTSRETPFIIQERKDKKDEITGWELKPVTVSRFAKRKLWCHGIRFLGMSGTILAPSVLARELGINQYDYKQIPSPFPTKHRPIYYWPVTNMRKTSIDNGIALPNMLRALGKIINKYPNTKMLIHAASYLVASAIEYEFGSNPRFITHNTDNRITQLDKFKESPEPLFMVSPSFDRGVDLPDDQCRCVVICKIPYLNLGDKQIAARIKAPGGDQWYVFKAIQTVMQMTGRGVRNKFDYCDTYILDAQFNSLLARTRQYIPEWWMESIKRIEEL